jgi:hypothetical protein
VAPFGSHSLTPPCDEHAPFRDAPAYIVPSLHLARSAAAAAGLVGACDVAAAFFGAAVLFAATPCAESATGALAMHAIARMNVQRRVPPTT